MGQSHSRRASNASDTPLNPTATHDSTLEQNYQAFYGTNNASFVAKNSSAQSITQPIAEITPPAPPPPLHRYSELIDPIELLSTVPEDAATISASSLYSQSNHSQINVNKRLPPLIQSPSGGDSWSTRVPCAQRSTSCYSRKARGGSGWRLRERKRMGASEGRPDW